VSFSPFYRPENIQKAVRAIENENQLTREFSTNAREALFQEALDRGDLDEDAIDAAERRGFDLDDISEGGVNPRPYVSVSDYPDYLPSPQGVDVDPDLEDYTGYRLAQQNPKLRGFLSNADVDLYSGDQRAVGQRFLEDYSQDLIPARDWMSLRDSFRSEVLEPGRDSFPTERQFDTADFVEREGTRGHSRGLNRNIYSGINELSNKVNYLDNLLTSRQLIEQEEAPGSPIRQRLANVRAIPNSSSQLSFYDQEVENLNELENRLTPSTPERLNDPTYLNARSRDIREISSAIEQAYYGGSSSRGRNTDAILDQMLPNVRDALGASGAFEAAQRQESIIRGDRNLAEQNQRLAEETSALQNLRNYRRLPPSERERYRYADLTSPQQRELIDPPSRDFINLDQGDQLVVPGLVEDLRKSKIEQFKQQPLEALARFEQVLNKYPEVRDLLGQEIKSERAVPIKEEEFKPYLKYADQEQMFSTPEIRKQLYENVLLDVEPELRPSLSQSLVDIEKKYTSGNPLLQQEARQKVNEFAGKQNVLALSEKLAFRPNRPVIGGGGYVDASDPEIKEKIAFIDSRAKEVNSALQRIYAEVPSDTFSAIYPGLKKTLNAAEAPVGFLLDDETGQVTRTMPLNNTYNIQISKSGSNQFFLANSYDITNNEKVSSNFVNFLVANPATSPRGIMFTSSRPGESRSFEAKTDIPAPITQAWEEEIKQQSFANLRPNTIVYNNPAPSRDLYESRLKEGLTSEQSSTLRKLKPFVESGQKLPNLRAISYSRAGFGPATVGEFGLSTTQHAFVTPQGKVLALQASSPESGLKGEVDITPDKISVTQSTLPFSSTPRYFSGDPVTGAAAGALELGRAIKKTPASLLPGAADLIPSPEAIQTGYKQGPAAMGKQMGREFVQSLPTGAVFASALATPALAPFAPGVGLGFVGSAAVKAANEVVRQETGEGIVPKVRQFIGTAPRTNVAGKPRMAEAPLTAEIKPLSAQGKTEMTRRQNRNELEKRLDLVKERFNPRKGEFGLSELLFGR
jgi:hypothetical protein